jgi:hypothetical protein
MLGLTLAISGPSKASELWIDYVLYEAIVELGGWPRGQSRRREPTGRCPTRASLGLVGRRGARSLVACHEVMVVRQRHGSFHRPVVQWE